MVSAFRSFGFLLAAGNGILTVRAAVRFVTRLERVRQSKTVEFLPCLVEKMHKSPAFKKIDPLKKAPVQIVGDIAVMTI